jgi:D-sedoheptulose 7-phosphate isomerase
MFRKFVSSYRKELANCFDELLPEKLKRVAEIFLRAQREGRRVFFLGNGGSASTASHMAMDFCKGTFVAGQPPLRAISLTDNVGLITAWANDANYESVFVGQLENLLEPQDVVVAISASGNSPNVLRAAEFARKRGAVTIGLVGFGGGQLKTLVDIDITVSSRNYGQVEDIHLCVNHILSQYIKEEIGRRQNTKEALNEQMTHLRFVFSDPPMTGIQRGILIDRDGVINERIVDGYVTEWEHFQFRDGIKRAMASLAELDCPIIVVSNQAGVGKRLISPLALQEITNRFVTTLKESGARVDAVYYCPHTADQNCSCRKPRTGLLEAAARDWKLDLTRSVLIGDSESDLQAARTSNCRAMLVSSHHSDSGRVEVNKHLELGVIIVRDTSQLAMTVRNLLQLQVKESGDKHCGIGA